jgi:hypothetical protein
MRVHTYALVAVALTSLGTAGCPNKNSDDSKTTAATPPVATVAPTPAPAPTPSAPTNLAPEGSQPTPGIDLRVKQEVDNRPDGITGSPIAVPGSAASVQAPTGWQITKGDFTVASSADKKAQIAAGAGADATSRLPAAASAMGLSGCTWNPPDAVTVGKTKLAGQAADGLCHRGTANVKAAYVAAEGLIVAGAWDDGGDSANVFGSMRSITKATGGGVDSIAACCAALRQNAKSAPPQQQGAYLMAASACDAARTNPQGRAMLGTIRGMLAGAAAPASCH